MMARIEHLKDLFSSNFLGVRLSPESVNPFKEQLRGVLGERYDLYAGAQERRDRGTHHVNVVTTKEYNELSQRFGIDKWVNHVGRIMDAEVDMTMLGLGVAQGGGSAEYFVVVRSEDLSTIRRSLGLPEKDFTACLGFYPAEVHGSRKNTLLPIRDPFLKLLAGAYYNNKSFDFIRDMEYFDGDPQSEIVPVEIDETSATFRSGRTAYYTLGHIGDGLRISARWQGEADRPRLSDTIVSRKLKNT